MEKKCQICDKELSDDEWYMIYRKKICGSEECKLKAAENYKPSDSPTFCRGGK